MATSAGLHEVLVMAKAASDAIPKVTIDDDDFVELTLSDSGMIRECSKAMERMFGYAPSKLMWQHVSVLLPQLSGMALVSGGEINHRLHFLAHIGHRFEMVGVGGMRSLVRICLNDGEVMGRHCVRLTICPAPDAGAY